MADALAIAVGNFDPLFFGINLDAGIQALNSTTLSTSGNAICMVLTVPKGDTITALGYHTGTVTGTPAVSSYTIGLQTVNTSGVNSGANYGGVAPTVFQPVAADANKWRWVPLASSYAATQGDIVAIVLNANGSITASNLIGAHASVAAIKAGFPYAVVNAAKVATVYPIMGMQSASQSYGRPFTGTALITVRNFGGTSGDMGATFVIPSGWCSTYKIRGIRIGLVVPATSTTVTFGANIYSDPLGAGSGPTSLIATDTSWVANDFTSNSGTLRTLEFTFQGTLPTLTAGTKYGVGFTCSANAGSSLYTMDVDTSTDFTAWPLGTNVIFMSRAGQSGAFAETTTRRPWLELIFDDITAPSGGSGMIVHPGMDGGCRG